MTAIILLNWNGADDTLCCLESLAKANGSFFVVVADNGSTDDSLKRIKEYISSSKLDIKLLENGTNYGFAKGNNLAVRYAARFNPDSYMLLNNDTEVTSDFLTRLEEFRIQNPEYKVLTPRINLYYDKGRIWNCGGRMFAGFRKYLFDGDLESKAIRRPYYRITFITGCALYFTPDILEPDGTLLTERFFFGEEDFEFCIRMKKRRVPMASVTDSVIYHKVSSSNKGKDVVGTYYLHQLNRYIDIRLNYGKLFTFLWRIANIPLSLRYLTRKSGSFSKALSLLRNLHRESRAKDCVTEQDFQRLVVKGNYFA